MSDNLGKLPWPWTLPNKDEPISKFRQKPGKLLARGYFDERGAYKGVVNYIDCWGRVVWSDNRNLRNGDVLRKMARRLAPRLEENPEDPWDKRRRAEVALEDCLNDLLQRAAVNGSGSQSSDDNEDEQGRAYHTTPDGSMWYGDKVVANFVATIVSQVKQDDGEEVGLVFEIQTLLKGRSYRFPVPAAEFSSMNWVGPKLGAMAVLAPGWGLRDACRAAIQVLSGDVAERVLFTHTGWRQIDNKWLYLHAGGAIGSVGSVPDINVELPPQLSGYQLPEPPTGEQSKVCIRASLAILEVSDERVTVPLLGTVYRSVLGLCDLSVFLCGESGSGKTAETTLIQQHFGPAMDALHLPASWESTANSLQVLAFSAKDALLLVYDFSPTPANREQLMRDADRLFRSAANKSPRNRLRSDATLRPPKQPRSLLLSTGEDTPAGFSLGSRLLKLHQVREGPGAVDWTKLTQCQRDAEAGLYAGAMAGFVRYLAPQYSSITQNLKDQVSALRGAAYQDGQHRRTPGLVADLAVGLSYFLDFAQRANAITQQEREQLWNRAWNVLLEVGNQQSEAQRVNDPTLRFLELLASCLTSGRAHLASVDGKQPYDPIQWGWRNGHQSMYGAEYQAQGHCIGWTEDTYIYLDAQAAYAAAQDLAKDQRDSIPVSLPTLKKRLDEKGLLVTEERGGKRRLEVRRILAGDRRYVLCLHIDTLVGYGSQEKVSLNNEIEDDW